MDSMDRIVTIILGGGRGTRLMPLTRMRSKPAVPFGGKYRLVDIPISNCIHAGLYKVFVLTQFNSFSLNRHVNLSYYIKDFRNSFVEIFAAEQTPENMNWFQGTADAVRQVMKHLRNYDPDYVLILSGDQLYTMDLKDLVETHMRDGDRGITVATTMVDRENASALGLMRVGEDNLITEFVEKPTDPVVLDGLQQADGRFIASMGIYVFDRRVLDQLIDGYPEHTDFGKEIIPHAMRSVVTKAYVHDGYWEDIGTIASFYEANLLLTRPQAEVKLFSPEKPIYTHARFLPPSHLGSVSLTDSLLCDGCYIEGGEIRDSVIGIRTVIGKDVHIERSVLMGAETYHKVGEGGGQYTVGDGSVIRNAIIDRDVHIGRRVRLENRDNLREYDDGLVEIRDGVIVVPKGTEVPEGYVL